VFTHSPVPPSAAQVVKAQVDTQAPDPSHWVPDAQAIPHMPQFALLLCRLTQLAFPPLCEGHETRPLVQLLPQWPDPSHSVPGGQTLPQPPQLPLSTCGSTQVAAAPQTVPAHDGFWPLVMLLCVVQRTKRNAESKAQTAVWADHTATVRRSRLARNLPAMQTVWRRPTSRVEEASPGARRQARWV
jgi:hypothetical protein